MSLVLNRPRSADPYLGSYSPWLSTPTNLTYQMTNLESYLPGLAREVRSRQWTVEAIIEEWSCYSPQTQYATLNRLVQGDLRDAFHLVIRAIQHADGQDLLTQVARYVHGELEDEMEADRIETEIFPANMTIHSQHLFRALAEVSSRCWSRSLGTVLHHFFTQNVRRVADYNSPLPLGHWCYAVLRACMPVDSRRDCIRKLLNRRPNFLRELDESNIGPAQDLALSLSDLVQGSPDIAWTGYNTRLLSPDFRELRLTRQLPLGHRHHRAFRPDEEQDIERLADDVEYHEQKAKRSRRELARLTVGSTSPHRSLDTSYRHQDRRLSRRSSMSRS